MRKFSKYTLCAMDAALKAGKLIKKGFGRTNVQISAKGKNNDLVTEYDIASENLIIDHFRKTFPKSSFLSEECGEKKHQNEEVEWIIDPIDGTINYAHKIPIFAISIAAKIKGKLHSGIIYQPISDELFVAEVNKGAFLNGKTIHVSEVHSLKYSLLTTEFSFSTKSYRPIVNILEKKIPLRRLGSAALNLAYVAAGNFDGFFAKGLYIWDYAAGIIMVKEAGGKISPWPKLNMSNASLLATNGKIHEELSKAVR